jgi:hypothetical protein
MSSFFIFNKPKTYKLKIYHLFKVYLLSTVFLLFFPLQKSIAETPVESLSKDFMTLIESRDTAVIQQSVNRVQKYWHRTHLPMAIEAFRYIRYTLSPNIIEDLIKKESGLKNLTDINALYFWLWNQDISPSADYANFKAELYRRIDSRFEQYFFNRQESARIRLDEIRWGGVLQDGIPPLRNPKMLSVKEADYLKDNHIVFGIKINGDARAYPKRILAWHEMFTDTIGGVDIAGVYCTLCGTVIPYRTNINGTQYTLGTSGFLYRSNKLMYDKATQSLWSTERGEPVLGPLVDKGIALPYESVVTTTWGEWRKRNPDTTVLSLDTGHSRDYSEGAAYADYFATDRLMFNTPFKDERLANKQEVLALRFAGAPNEQLAIDTDFLILNRLYKNKIGSQSFIVLTDNSGANRVYDPEEVNFVAYDGISTLRDNQNNTWTLDEEKITNEKGRTLNRLPYHRAFWFGWHAAYPQTKLIK